MTEHTEDTQPTPKADEFPTLVPGGLQTVPAERDEEPAAMPPGGEYAMPAGEPPPALPATEPGKPRRQGMGRPVDYFLLWLVALASVAMNVFLISTLLTIQQELNKARLGVAEGLTAAANEVGQLDFGAFSLDVVVDESVPLDISVPISETIIVPISDTIEINSAAVADLPLLGLTAIPFSVDVPVVMTVTVPVSLTVQVTDSVPVNFIVPVDVNLDDTPLQDFKAEIQSYLLSVAADLQQGGTGVSP